MKERSTSQPIGDPVILVNPANSLLSYRSDRYFVQIKVPTIKTPRSTMKSSINKDLCLVFFLLLLLDLSKLTIFSFESSI